MTDPATIAGIFNIGKSLIQRIWPDPAKQAEELRKLEELKQTGDLARLQAHVDLMMGQINVNLQEAKHKSLFVAGWRPAVGWTCVSAFVYQFVVYPLLLWLWAIMTIWVELPEGVGPPPPLNVGLLVTILTGMLGIGGMRSYDKTKGVQTDVLGRQ